MMRHTFVKLCRGEDDWEQIKSCFVRAFSKYPLFQYVVPEENKRAEFLQRYLEAHYDISVRNGSSPLVCVHLTQENTKSTVANDAIDDRDGKITTRTKIIGGVLFTGPSEDGVGWEYEDDDVYERVYKKFGLREVDESAFERLTRFEAWETKHITSKLFALRIPMWNGVFCAIDPSYANAGVGTMNYADCINIVCQAQMNRQSQLQKPIFSETPSSSFVDRIIPPSGGGLSDKYCQPSKSTVSKNFNISMIHSLSLLTHQNHSLPSSFYKNVKTLPTPSQLTAKNMDEKLEEKPLMILLSQSYRAVEFHKRNGFKCVLEKEFKVPTSDCFDHPVFTEYVLVSDPFGRGNVENVIQALSH